MQNEVVDIRDALVELKNALVDTEGIVVGTFKSFRNLKVFINSMNIMDLDPFLLLCNSIMGW